MAMEIRDEDVAAAGAPAFAVPVALCPSPQAVTVTTRENPKAKDNLRRMFMRYFLFVRKL
jgi:hypothetical protein